MATTVEQLYRNVLGREPDPGGLAYWSQQFGPTVDANELATFRSVAAVTEPGVSNALAPAPAAPATGAGDYWRYNDPRWSSFKPVGSGEIEQPAKTYESSAPKYLLYEAAQRLGYTGPFQNPDPEVGGYAPELDAFWAQKRAQGYDLAVKHPDRNTAHSYYALVGPDNQPIEEFQVKSDALEVVKQLGQVAALATGANLLGNALMGGAGGAGGAAGAAGIAEGMVPGGLAAAGIPATAAELGAVGALTGAGAGGIGPGIAEGMAPGGLASAGVPPTSAETAAVGALTGTGRGLGAGIPSAIGQAATGAASGLGQAAGQAISGAAKGLGEASIWGPLISSLASLYGGEKAAAATTEAARLQSEAANRAIGLQETMYREGVERQRPFLEQGTAAFNRLAALQMGGPEAAQQFLTTEPGYGFRLGEGLKALERTQAARGNLLSGGAIKAGQRYAQDVASQEYQNAYNRLAQMAGIGPQAAGVANTLGQTYASNVGNLATQQGAAQANALLGGAAARQSAYGDIGKAWGQYFAPQPVINYLGGGGYGR